MTSSNFVIQHQCPQCGAPAELHETDRLFTCDFCKVRSYLVPGDVFRYCLPDKIPESRERIFYPYWRFKGMLFFCTANGIRPRFIDVSHQALSCRHFPHSLGFRSQALKLRFATSESNARFLQPEFSLNQIMESFEERFAAQLPKPIYHQAHIGDSLSLIYAPYYLGDRVYDGVLNEALGGADLEAVEFFDQKARPLRWGLQFLATLCPNCGWDLEGARDALVLMCRNCDTVWQAGKKKLESIQYGSLSGSGPVNEGDEPLYLPFWRIGTEISGVRLQTYADLAALANLPKVRRSHWDNIPFRFWSPAFKIRPQTFLPLATKMTLAEPRRTPESHIPQGSLYPVNLPVREAAESLKVILAGFIKPRQTQYPRLGDIQIRPRSYLLVYVPFFPQHGDLVQPEFHFTIRRSQLAHSGNL